MDSVGEAFFENHPDPMWVYAADSLRFLSVNQAAVASYGFSEAEFLAMTIRDIRPPDEVPELLTFLGPVVGNKEHPRVWRHRRKDGSILFVDIRSRDIKFDGREARLVVARDVSNLVQFAEDRDRLTKELSEPQKLKAAEAINLLEIAGRIARLGGWQVNIGADHVVWTKETAEIHELPADTSPTVEQAIQYYAPEYRERIREAVRLCAEGGPHSTKFFKS